MHAAGLATRDVWGEECFLLHEGPLEVLASMWNMDRWAGRPPLFWFFRAFSLKALGIGPWGLRLPSLLFAAAAVPATWMLARRLVSGRTALVATLALHLAALPAYFARESHSYSLSVLVTVGLLAVAAESTRPVSGTRLPLLGGLMTLVALATSIPLWPLALATGVIAAWHLRGRGASRFLAGQCVAWGITATVFVGAWLRLRSRGGSLLEMGGGDGGGGSFDDNDTWPTLLRAVDGLAFGHHSPVLESSVGWLLPAATTLSVLVLLRRRAPLTTLGVLGVAGFVGLLVPFWLLSAVFDHDHRLDTRYFVHLAPVVVIAWASALERLPRGVRVTGEVALVVVLGWGLLRSQVAPNRALSDAVGIVALHKEAGHVGVGPADYFEGECLAALPVPRVELDGIPGGTDGLWVIFEKDDADRLPALPRTPLHEALVEEGFDLAFEHLILPPRHEEFGQVAVLGFYAPGPHALHESGAFDITANLPEAWLETYERDEYPLRPEPLTGRTWDDQQPYVLVDAFTNLVSRAQVSGLHPRSVYLTQINDSVRIPGVGRWPPPTPLGTLRRSGPFPIRPRPLPFAARRVPALTMLVGLLVLAPLLFVGAGLSVARPTSLTSGSPMPGSAARPPSPATSDGRSSTR